MLYLSFDVSLELVFLRIHVSEDSCSTEVFVLLLFVLLLLLYGNLTKVINDNKR